MHLSRLGYFAEFLLFPPLVIFATALALHNHANPSRFATWLCAYGSGVGAWTLIEYLMHRIVFHHAPVLSRMHELHHDSPRELIGSPVWASTLSGLIGVAMPSWAVFGFYLATAATAGIVTGYLWYVFVHFSTHHRDLRRGSYLYRARLRHARHHYLSHRSNFGVTTELWDHVFGTATQGQLRLTIG